MASIAFGPNELPGFLFTQSDGHLLVIIGFTSTGDVIVNDPAATTIALGFQDCARSTGSCVFHAFAGFDRESVSESE